MTLYFAPAGTPAPAVGSAEGWASLGHAVSHFEFDEVEEGAPTLGAWDGSFTMQLANVSVDPEALLHLFYPAGKLPRKVRKRRDRLRKTVAKRARGQYRDQQRSAIGIRPRQKGESK